MKYKGRAGGVDTEISIEKEGIRFDGRFLDYADIQKIVPLNHRVIITTLDPKELEISMLGFSYEGFWEELIKCYGNRSMEALFIEEEQVMRCEGEYHLPMESGRGEISLFPDAICVLPPSKNAVRIPLCFVKKMALDGYMLKIEMTSGVKYELGRMGYDTKPFAERAGAFMNAVKSKRKKALVNIKCEGQFTEKGLFRTENTDEYWQAAFGNNCCAVELYTSEQTATYLYRYSEAPGEFLSRLNEAMEALGTHREVIYYSDEQIKNDPVYRMSVERSEAVRFLRARSAGRIIHSASHAQKLGEFLKQG